MMIETPRPQFPTRKPVLRSPVTHPQMAFAVRGERAERQLVQQLVAQPPAEALHESATMFPEFAITLAADAQDGIVGCASAAQTTKTVLVDQLLPGKKLINRQRITAACFFERKQPTANRSNYFGFASNHPSFRSRRWQVGHR